MRLHRQTESAACKVCSVVSWEFFSNSRRTQGRRRVIGACQHEISVGGATTAAESRRIANSRRIRTNLLPERLLAKNDQVTVH